MVKSTYVLEILGCPCTNPMRNHSCDGVLFSRRCPFLHRDRKIWAYFGYFVANFCCTFTGRRRPKIDKYQVCVRYPKFTRSQNRLHVYHNCTLLLVFLFDTEIVEVEMKIQKIIIILVYIVTILLTT